MKKLTPEQKLEVIREARECYKEIIQGSVLNYGVICGSIGRTLYNKGLVNKDYNNYMVREMFPELMKHKPEHVPPGGNGGLEKTLKQDWKCLMS